MISAVSSPLSVLLASTSPLGRGIAQANQQNAQAEAIRAIKAGEQSVKMQAQSLRISAGPNATLSTQYDYAVGPDGQLYVRGVTVTTQRRVDGQLSAINPDARQQQAQQQARQPFAQPEKAPTSFAEITQPRALLSPADEAVLYGSDDFRQEAFHSVDNLNRAKFLASDIGVRNHEGLHYRAGAGATTLPEFTLQEGPDGQFYAIGGSVGIDPAPAATPEEAARDAITLANAALAANDVSAQDISVARNALSRAAYMQQQQRQQQVANLYKVNNDIVTNNTPLLNAAA